MPQRLTPSADILEMARLKYPKAGFIIITDIGTLDICSNLADQAEILACMESSIECIREGMEKLRAPKNYKP